MKGDVYIANCPGWKRLAVSSLGFACLLCEGMALFSVPVMERWVVRDGGSTLSRSQMPRSMARFDFVSYLGTRAGIAIITWLLLIYIFG